MYFATNLSKIFDIARKNRRILFPCPLHHIPQIFPRVFEGFGKFEEALVGRASLGGLVEHVIANTGIIRRGDRCRVVVLSLQEEVDSTAVVLPSIVTFSQTGDKRKEQLCWDRGQTWRDGSMPWLADILSTC